MCASFDLPFSHPKLDFECHVPRRVGKFVTSHPGLLLSSSLLESDFQAWYTPVPEVLKCRISLLPSLFLLQPKC